MSENTNSHSGLHVVIQKGKARCASGSTSCAFKVTSHALQHANGTEPDNLIVTESDLTFAQTPPFGSCSLKNGNTCSYAPQGKWQNTYPKIKVLGKTILTEASTLTCTTGGIITVESHGQTQQVINAHFDNVDLEELQMLSPLAGKPEPGKEMPQVKHIEVCLSQQKEKESIRKNEVKKGDSPIPEVIVRKDEELVFRVSSYHNKNVSKVDKTKVNWIIYDGKGYTTEKLSLLEYGEELKFNFDEYGEYHVHAYGKSPKDNRCSFIVQVKQNELTQEGIQTTGGNILGDKLRRGAVTPFQAKFIFPPDSEEKNRVRMYVKDPSGAEADGAVFTPETGLLFSPKNKGDYSVYVEYTREDGSLQQVSKKYKSIDNSVSKITATPSADTYRPGTTLAFEVSQMKFSFLEDGNDTWDRGEYARIKWNVNGKQVSTVGTKYTATFNTPGNYVVESYVSVADAHKKKEDDDWRFTITKNKVSGFTCGLLKNLLIGKIEEIEVTTLMPYNAALDGVVTWKSNNPGIKIISTSGIKAQIKAVGEAIAGTITAELNGVPIPLLITAAKAEIKRWCITDKELNFKRYAGWEEELYGVIESTPLLAGEKVTLHLLEGYNAKEGYIRGENNTSHLYKIGEAVFDEKGIAKALFKTDSSLKQKLEAKGKLGKWEKEGEEYELFLVIESTTIQFKGSAETAIEGVKYTKPAKEVKFNGQEQNLYTFIDNKQDVTSIRFLKPNGKDAYEIIRYGEKITLKAQTRNLNGSDLKLKLLWNRLSKGIKEYPQNKVQKVENETASWQIDTNVLKGVVPSADHTRVALWNVEITDKDGDHFKYPGELARVKDGKLDWSKLITYQTLKLSDNTTLSELAKNNAPLIIGEPLEVEAKEEGKCVCEERVRAYMRMLRVGEGTEGESGYIKLFGGKYFTQPPHNKTMSDHPNIKVYWCTNKNGEKVYSSASGAYQVMGYTWKDSSMIEKRKKYNITNFTPENQDRFCIVLFKHKRKGMLELITQGKIQEATETYGSYEWASLPPGRHGQPNKTMKEALALYDKYLKEELEGKSDLHIKKGFLKDFAHICNCGSNSKTIKEGKCTNCNENHIDLSNDSKWQTQFSTKFGTKKQQNVACWRACKVILSNYNIKGGDNINPIQMVSQNGNNLKIENVKEGREYLNKELVAKRVVLIGVDDGRTASYNTDKTTEHFIVIVGKGCENGSIFYRYYDVGTAYKDRGININNKLYLQPNGIIKGKSPGGTKTYTIAQVRRNK